MKILDLNFKKILVINNESDLTAVKEKYESGEFSLRLQGEFSEENLLKFSNNFHDLFELSTLIYSETSYDFLYNLTQLQTLNLIRFISKIDFSNLLGLSDLSLAWNRENIKDFEGLINLKRLHISGYDKYNLDELSNLSNLEYLRLDDNPKIKSLKGIETIVSLKVLILGACRNLKDISDLQNLQNLKFIQFDGCAKIGDFSSLQSNRELEVLEVLDSKKISSISFVKNLPNLIQLSLLGNTEIEDCDTTPAINIENVYGATKRKYNLKLKYKEKKTRKGYSEYLK